ncbi:DUF3054 domain-containing protein [Kocuria sp. p3-SID1433]|uniref:DUF3054 domain-containing protein n=1 Tax=unclassified Kocuria TaxID=2649579 RepID=UPI0021A6EAD4|nr:MULTISPECIES: DUF3054 domain-containing protein [unclassified Kocuria]MCT1602673.1 DUF3054 domain-containing protein [Kocuria sp. p3-SID1428]MCT2180680.1 DUF3054 domain-containing protein [Kocuria sp. p3-SID1433]
MILWFALDAALVCLFGAIGKSSHDGSAWQFFDASWPFLVGLGLGWLAVAFLRRPGRELISGLIIWVLTVLGGAVLRVASGDGAPASFLIVTASVLLVFLLGWRLIAALVVRLPR